MLVHPSSPAFGCERGFIDTQAPRRRGVPFALVWALLLALGAPGAARAEDGDDGETAESAPAAGDDAPMVEAEDMVITAERLPPEQQPPTAATTTVELTGTPGLEADLAAPLSRVPSVTLHRTGSTGSRVTTSIRGSASDQVVVRLGGLPLTPPGGGLVDLSAIPPALLSSLTVVRGSEAALSGAGALGGTLELSPLRTRGASGLELEAGGGSFGTALGSAIWRGEVGPARVAAGLAGTLSAGRFDYERDLTPSWEGDDWVDETRSHNRTALGSLLLAADAPLGGGRLQLTAFGHRGVREVPGLVGFPTPEATSDAWRTLAGAAWEGAPGRLRPKARAWIATDAYDYDPGTPGGAAGFAASGRRRVLGAEGGLRLLAGVHLLGADLRTDLETFDDGTAPVRRASASLTLSDVAWVARDRVALHGAVRLAAFEDEGLLAMPRGGVEVTLGAGWSLAANLAHGSRLPTLAELHADTALVTANPDLRAETATTADLGVRWRGARVEAAVSAYASRYRDLITYELYPPLRLRPFNVDRARVLGGELELTARPADRLALTAAYGLTDARALGDDPNLGGRRLPYRPPHRGLVRADLDLARVRLWAEAEAQAAMPRNRANTKTLPARLLVGAGGEVRLTRSLFAALTLSNLLDDRRLEDLYGYPLPGRAVQVSARLVLPGAGR